MSSKKGAMKKKLENMHLGERINYGFQYVKLCKQGKCF